MPKVRQYNTKSLYFSTRITQAMQGFFDRPLTFVDAPMGYGKTTAVREFLNHSDVLVLWQTVFDTSLGSFWQNFSRLFAAIDEDASQRLLELGFPHDNVLLHEAVRIIADVTVSAETFLVIDDYHLIESREIDRLIERVAMYNIPGLHIVLITRYIGQFNVDELSLKGYLHPIAKEIFELTSQEIAEYYKTCGISLGNDETERLHALTEGWISALYLFLLEFVAKGSYSPENNIYQLIEKSVYTPLSEETKEFLLTLSIFNSFTLKQAAHMWGKENTGKLLSVITSKNAFVKYDGRTKTYYAHNIFTGFLKETLGTKDVRYKNDLYQRAAGWFLKAGDCRIH